MITPCIKVTPIWQCDVRIYKVVNCLWNSLQKYYWFPMPICCYTIWFIWFNILGTNLKHIGRWHIGNTYYVLLLALLYTVLHKTAHVLLIIIDTCIDIYIYLWFQFVWTKNTHTIKICAQSSYKFTHTRYYWCFKLQVWMLFCMTNQTCLL